MFKSQNFSGAFPPWTSIRAPPSIRCGAYITSDPTYEFFDNFINKSSIFVQKWTLVKVLDVCLYAWSGSEGYPLCFELMLERFLEIASTKLLKMHFPDWELFLKTLAQKYWPQYLGNYTDSSDGTYTYLGNYTDGTKWDCIIKCR